MKKIILAIVLAGISSASASAADLGARAPMRAPAMVAPVSPWQGFYVGLNAGYAWGNSNPTQTATYQAVPGPGEVETYPSSLKPRGFIGGGQIGYNWQSGAWVLGTELDFSGLNAQASQTIARFSSIGPGAVYFSARYDWLLTARLRAGVAIAPNWLLYATGGFAAAGAKDSINYDLTADIGAFLNWSESKTLTGWAVGAGTEYAFAPNWSVKAEYLHVALGNTSPASPTAAPTFSTHIATFHHNLDIVRAGVNYHF